MRARRKGADSYSRIARVQLEDSDILYHASVMEFEPDTPSTDSKPCPQTDGDKHWQEIRAKAAIAAMQGTMAILASSDRGAFREIVVEGYSGKEKTYPKEIAEFAVACADALIEELKKK